MKKPPEHTLFSVNEVELVYHSKIDPRDKLRLNSSRSVYDVLLSAWDLNKIELVEQVMVVMLDRGNHCLGISCIATGGVSECVVDAKIVFATALKANASQIILAHNHPSGNLCPSKNDVNITKKLMQGARLLDMQMVDHLIVSRHGYNSFAEDGWSAKDDPLPF